MRTLDLKTTKRAQAYELWMDAPNPMVTFFKIFDITQLIRPSRRTGSDFYHQTIRSLL